MCSDMMEYEPKPDLEKSSGNSDSFQINEDRQTVYASKVTLSSNVSGAVQMRFSNTGTAGTWSSWIPYSASHNWIIEYNSFSSCTVYAEFMDADANITQMNDSIYFINRIIPDLPVPDSGFGDKISISADGYTVAVTATDYAASKDTIFIFHRENDEWIQVFRTDLPDFIRDIALSPDGMYFAASTSTNTLSDQIIHFFKKTGTVWSAVSDSANITNEGFGESIDFSYNSDYLAVSRYKSENGKVDIFLPKSGYGWYLSLSYSDYTPDDNTNDWFGRTVKFLKNSSTLIVTAPNRRNVNSGNGFMTNPYGAILICGFNGTDWDIPSSYDNTSTAIYLSADIGSLNFNHEISENGNLILLTSAQYNSGKGYSAMFQKNGSSWTQTEITPHPSFSPLISNDRFGISGGIDSLNSNIYIGCMRSTGSVSKYQISDIANPQLFTFSELENNDKFGYSMDISDDGRYIAAGAPGKTVNSTSKSGAVYILNSN